MKNTKIEIKTKLWVASEEEPAFPPKQKICGTCSWSINPREKNTGNEGII